MPKEESFFQEHKTFLYFALGFTIFFIILAIFQPTLLKWLQKDPEIYDTYIFVVAQLQKHSFLWLAAIAAIGALFFIAIPTDLIFVYYILTGANPLLTILYYFLGLMLGRILDYWTGFIFSKFVIEKILKEDYSKFNNRFARWGIFILIGGNFIPFFPLEPFITFLGTIRFDFWKVLLYNGLGKLTKLFLLVFFMKYFVYFNLQFLDFNFFKFIQTLMEYLMKVLFF